MQKKILENIIGQLNEKKREYEIKAEGLSSLIEFFKNEADIKKELYKIEIKSPMSFLKSKNIVLIKRGPIEEILKEAERNFNKENKENIKDKVYKVSILIVRGRKTLKIPISEEIITALIRDTL
jgi:hypothetical protein